MWVFLHASEARCVRLPWWPAVSMQVTMLHTLSQKNAQGGEGTLSVGKVAMAAAR